MKYDVIIVGAGVAGLYTAINLDSGLRVLLLSKSGFMTCNTALAQGGIAIERDDVESHIEDSLKSGGHTNNREHLRIMCEGAVREYEALTDLGVEFDPEPGLEGGHSRRRIVHCKDSTGSAIITALLNKVKTLPNVDCAEHTDFFGIGGAAPAIVLATGGIGQVYHHTTNSPVSTGDGIAFAHSVGAKIEGMDLVQFHPTAFRNGELLITEAVRGEGGRLLNSRMERFTDELQPRDTVSRAIINETERLGNRDIFLDISHKPPDFVKNRFPMLYERLLAYGCDMARQPIPIYPCQHYLMGGITVDSRGHTSVEGLYAVGECSYTGVHGNNRLASNSLLESLVFSRRAAELINSDMNNRKTALCSYRPENIPVSPPDDVMREIRDIMQQSFFVTPRYEQIPQALARITQIKEANAAYNNSPATIAYLILKEVTKNAQ
jgi:L-aspartate oxidase